MEDFEERIREPFCYVCIKTDNLSIKARRKTIITYICKDCRNAQHKAWLKKNGYRMPAKRTKEIGWTEDWITKSQSSIERISKRGLNYGV